MRHLARLVAIVALGLAAEGTANATAPARTTSSGAREKWGTSNVEITLDPSLAVLGDGAFDAIRGAFGAWLESDVMLPRLTFVVSTTNGEAKRDGVNRVLATHGVLAGHERDVAYTTSWADAATGAMLEADVVFNLDYAFATMASAPASCTKRPYDVSSIATHEAGHFLGLGEDVEDATTTMWITTEPCDVHKRALHDGDLVSIEALYTTRRPKGPQGTQEVVIAGCNASGSGEGGRRDRSPLLLLGACVAVLLLRRRGVS